MRVGESVCGQIRPLFIGGGIGESGDFSICVYIETGAEVLLRGDRTYALFCVGKRVRAQYMAGRE